MPSPAVTEKQYAALAALVYDRSLPTSGFPIEVNAPDGTRYILRALINDDESGYRGAIFEVLTSDGSSGGLIVSHCGTEFEIDMQKDLLEADGQMAVMEINQQIAPAMVLVEYARSLAAASGVSVTVTGHSLGGSLAQATAAHFGLYAETFNAYGVADMGISEGSATIVNHVRITDLVGTAGSQIGQTYYYATELDIDLVVPGFETPLEQLDELIASFNPDETHAISQFFGDDSILTDAHKDRYLDNQTWYDLRVGMIRSLALTFEGTAEGLTVFEQLFVHGYKPLNTIQRWLEANYEATQRRVFLGTGENDERVGTERIDIMSGGGGSDRLSGGAEADLLFGGSGVDTLRGESGDDALYGEADNDYLDGGAGNDHLSGGTGHDRYSFSIADFQSTPGSTDTVVDADGAGQIEIDNVALSIGNRTNETTWESLDGQFTIMTTAGLGEPQTLAIQHKETGATILVQNWTNGALGIALGGQVAVPDPGFVLTEKDDDSFFNFLNQDTDDIASALGGNDGLSGNYGDDTLDGGSGDDLILGGSGNDKLFGGDGNDVISDFSQRVSIIEWDDERPVYNGLTEKELYESNITELGVAVFSRGNSWFVFRDGDSYSMRGIRFEVPSHRTDPNFYPGGDDFIDGGGGNDLISAGEGNDSILGGEGDDTIYGGHDNDVINGGSGNDEIEGDVPFTEDPNVYGVSDAARFNGNDVIDGGAGNDIIRGQGGSDVVYGGIGDDILRGRGEDRPVDPDDPDADYIDGGVGNDQISGDDGADTLLGGSGNDTIRGDQETAQTISGNDFIDGGSGDDTLFGDGGNDTILGGDGADHIQGDELLLSPDKHGDDMLSGGAGNDVMAGQGGDDVLMGDDGDDQLIGDASASDLALAYHGNDQLFGGAGNDLAWGGGGNDTLSGGAGNDRLDGEQGDDTLSGGEDNDHLFGGAGNDSLAGDAGDDALVGNEGNDTLSGGAGIDILDAGAGNDTLDGGSGNDTLDGDEGDDVLSGADGDDAVYGGAGNDLLIGGAGNDGLAGAQGDDRYVFNLGWGVDSIQGLAAADAGRDTILFGAGISASDIVIAADAAGNVLLSVAGGTDRLALLGFLTAANASHRIEFADGTVWTQETLLAILAPSGGDGIGDAGDNLIVGSKETANHLYGGLGNDTLIGGAGGDIIHGGGGDPDAGGVLDNDAIFGGAGDDRINGEDGGDLIDGGAGDDDLTGGHGADRLLGGDGNDRLDAGWTTWASGLALHETSDDFLDGGRGDDSLRAGLGKNTYLFEQGFGRDRLFLTQASTFEISSLGLSSEHAILRFGSSITAQNLQFTRENGNLVVSHGADSLTIVGFDARGTATLEFRFDDGSVLSQSQMSALTQLIGTQSKDRLIGGDLGDVLIGLGGSDVLTGNAGDDVLVGGKGEDWLSGGAGDDTYRYGLGDGVDYIGLELGASGNDVLELDAGIAQADLRFYTESWANGDGYLYIVVIATGNFIRLDFSGGQTDQALDSILLADGSSMTIADAIASSSPLNWQQVFTADDGASSLVANEFANTIHGNSSYGTVLQGDRGDDTYYLNFGKKGLPTEHAAEGNDTVVTNYSGYVLPENIENLVLENDGSWYSFVRSFTGNALDNVIDAAKVNLNEIYRLDGGAGADILIGSDVRNIYVVDNELDTIIEPASSTSVDTVEAAFTYSIAGQLELENLTLLGADDLSATGNARDNVLTGNAGANVLTGGAGNDTLDGKDGVDILIGGGGNDLYIWDGIDAIVELVGEGVDTVVLAALPAGTSVIGIPSGLDNVEVYELGGNLSDNVTLIGSDRDDVIVGNSKASTLSGGGGNDELRSGGNNASYSDYLNGDGGNDLLISGSGYVVLNGGAGDDEMRLAQGTESIRYQRGDGSDTIVSLNGNNHGMSTFQFGTAINPHNVVWTRDGNDLVITFADISTDQIRIQDYWKQIDGVDALSGVIEQFSFHGESGYRTGLTVGGLGNSPPIRNYASLDAAATSGQLFTYTLPHDAFWDEVPESLIYSVDALPAWLTFDPLTRTLQGTAPAGSSGGSFQVTVTDQYGATANLLLVLSVMNVIQGTSGNDSLAGTSGSDSLMGGAGNDTLDGGAGADRLFGGTGNDTYVVDNWDDEVIELSGEGDDLVNASVSYGLPKNVERLTLTGTATEGDGNDLDNIITGNSSANSLYGNEGNDTLTGNNGNDELYGGSGDDTLDGGSGNDYMSGDEGDDTYIVGSAGDQVEEWEFSGTDTVRSSVTYTLGYEVENLVLTGSSGLTGNGNELDNVLTGNSGANTLRGYEGNDTLDGGTGNDTMLGGTGDDTYVVNATGDVVTELANEGTDLVRSAVTYTLGNNLESLVLTGTSAINGTGNALDNVLTGNSGTNSLTGGAGNDTLEGAAGTDTLTGGTGTDTYLHGRGYGADTVVENDATAGATDVARFLSGVAYDQLWFARPSGTNNLEISIIGTSDKLTIKDWYKGSQYQVEEIRTADGNYLLTAAKVQTLVTKMATMTKPTTTTLTTAQRSQLTPVFATTWVQQTPLAGLMARGDEAGALGLMPMSSTLQGTGGLETIMPGGCYPQTPGDQSEWRDRMGGHVPGSRIETWLEAHGYASLEAWLARTPSERPSGDWLERFQDRRYGGMGVESPHALDELYGSLADVMANDRFGLAGQDRTMRGLGADVAVECQRLISAMSLADAPDLSLAANCEVWGNRQGMEAAMF